jgi:outer membrane biosynthesis protein TonB
MRGRKVGRTESKDERQGPSRIRLLNFCLSAFLPLCLASACALSACTRAQAKVTPDQPLEVPAPPPREVEVSENEPPPPVALVPEPARNAPSRSRSPATPREPQRAEPARPDAAKPEPAQTEPPKPIEDPKPPVIAPSSPPTTLQTTPATAEGEVERVIRASLARANADLNRIDYRALNRDARTQYDTAKRFVLQSERALGEKNLVFAKSVADKAAALAAQLAGR